jgi:hypothetical protein
MRMGNGNQAVEGPRLDPIEEPDGDLADPLEHLAEGDLDLLGDLVPTRLLKLDVKDFRPSGFISSRRLGGGLLAQRLESVRHRGQGGRIAVEEDHDHGDAHHRHKDFVEVSPVAKDRKKKSSGAEEVGNRHESRAHRHRLVVAEIGH